MTQIPHSMEALILYGPGRFEVARVPVPGLGPRDVLVRVAWCGVCGSDLPRMYETGAHGHPRICGHEFSGIVAAVGPEATHVQPGTRVVVFPLIWCGRCRACETGVYARCTHYDYLGSRSDGGFAEFVRAPAHNLLPIPDSLALDSAAMVEPAAVALHALRQGGGTGPYDAVAVIGCGPIGVMTAMWAQYLGAGRVLLFDVAPQRLQFAAELTGADSFDARDADIADIVHRATDGIGADLVIDAAGAPPATAAAIASCAPGGRVVLLGNPGGDVHLPRNLAQQVLRRELRICGTWNAEYRVSDAGDDWHAVVRAMADGAPDFRPLVTHRVPLAQAPDALEMLRSRAEFAMKVLIGDGAGEYEPPIPA